MSMRKIARRNLSAGSVSAARDLFDHIYKTSGFVLVQRVTLADGMDGFHALDKRGCS